MAVCGCECARGTSNILRLILVTVTCGIHIARWITIHYYYYYASLGRERVDVEGVLIVVLRRARLMIVAAWMPYYYGLNIISLAHRHTSKRRSVIIGYFNMRI